MQMWWRQWRCCDLKCNVNESGVKEVGWLNELTADVAMKAMKVHAMRERVSYMWIHSLHVSSIIHARIEPNFRASDKTCCRVLAADSIVPKRLILSCH